ncbi:MAG: NADH-quinone oxidoreductase subunit NuoA [Acidimicrobiia bacterium]|nr:MAG: NADH-quinone oxidoreductase subunit NuoA [Acidimicrobiia bacterium]
MRNEYFGDYVTVAIFLLAGAAIVAMGIMAARLVAPSRPNVLKSTAYESGIEPTGGGWNQSHIRYYIFALLFLVFDVEAVFVFPWAVNLDGFAEAGLGVQIYLEMVAFVLILLLGLIYAIRKGVLRWE